LVKNYIFIYLYIYLFFLYLFYKLVKYIYIKKFLNNENKTKYNMDYKFIYY